MRKFAVNIDITGQKEKEQKLRESEHVLRRHASGLQSLREKKRKVIAREVHDELGQVLTAMKIDISLLRQELKDQQLDVAEIITRLDNDIDSAMFSVRNIAASLRPAVLDNLGLDAAIEWQLNEYARRAGYKPDFKVRGKAIPLDDEISTSCFRIFQELLTNVSRHSRASQIAVELIYEAEKFSINVCDDGIGITDGVINSPYSLGFLGMRERAHLINGNVNIGSGRHGGTLVVVTIPL